MTTGSPAGSSLAFFKVSSPPNNGPRQPKSDLETGTKGTKQMGTIAVELGYRDSARTSRVNETSFRHHGPAGRASNLEERLKEYPELKAKIEAQVALRVCSPRHRPGDARPPYAADGTGPGCSTAGTCLFPRRTRSNGRFH